MAATEHRADESSLRWLGVAAILLLVGGLAVLLLRDTDTTPPSSPSAAPVAAAAQGSSIVEHPGGRLPQPDGPESNATFDRATSDQLGAICLEAVSMAGSPRSGVRISLVRNDSQRKWLLDGEFKESDALVTKTSDPQGRCIFGQLQPGGLYQLVALTSEPTFFKAQPSPLQRRRSGRVHLNKSFPRQALDNKRVSGRIPVTANTVTRTQLIVAQGCTIRGAVTGGPWDSVVVSLSRRYRSVQRTIDRCRTSPFEFTGVVASGTLDASFRARKANDLFFGIRKNIPLQDGMVVDINLQPWDPSSSIELVVQAPDKAKSVPGVHVTLYREDAPRLRSDFVVTMGKPIRVHGMVGARIVSLSPYPTSAYLSGQWHWPEVTDVSGLRDECIIGPRHEIRMRRQ